MSINWGPWADGGMASEVSAGTRRRWAGLGIRHLPATRALDALERVLARGDAQATVADIDWDRYVRQFTSLPGMLRLVAQAQAAASAGTGPSLRDRLASAPPRRRLPLLVEQVSATALNVLGLPPSYALDLRQGLRDVGLDSLMAVELRNHLQLAVDSPLPTTLAFDYPTVDAIVRYLADVLSLDLGARADAAPAPAAAAADSGIDELTDDEAEAALMAELGAFRPSARVEHE